MCDLAATLRQKRSCTVRRHTYAFKRLPDGTTDINVVVIREGKNLKGWLLGFVLGTIGRSVLEKAFNNSIKAIEARNISARPSPTIHDAAA